MLEEKHAMEFELVYILCLSLERRGKLKTLEPLWFMNIFKVSESTYINLCPLFIQKHYV
jgi:hypothetical protein